MYTITSNKNFIFIFFKKEKKRQSLINKTPINLETVSLSYIMTFLKNKAPSKYYVSKIYICKFIK